MVMELCEGSLIDIALKARDETDRTGLPPIDVVVLGLMLVDAVAAVHRRARSVHLDIKPDNVLLTFPRDNSDMRSVKLADFGFSKRLPSCVKTTMVARSNVASIAVGNKDGMTVGYAPLEQMKKQGRRASDVYSMGATLLFALTCRHPYGNNSDYESVVFSLIAGV
jgi:eukaryotic-like serine/threonine-protein kinase